MKRPGQPHQATSSVDSTRRDAWEELLLRRVLQAHGTAAHSTDETWRRISGRIAAHEQLRSIHETMALRGAELRRIVVLSRPWPSLLALFG
jgi:hypothetical protein